jgi:hypothetical protein
MRVLALAALAVLPACADFESPEDPTFGLPNVVVEDPSFTRDVEPILHTRCATGGCHTTRTAQGGLVLERGESYDQIVGKPSAQGMLRITPGDPEQSWLVRRIEPDDSRRPGWPRMPLAATPLTANQITTIRNWVADGALRN